MQFQLTITFDIRTQHLDVQGNCLGDRMVCFGMVELAKVAINDMFKEQASKKILELPPGTRLPPPSNGPRS